MTAYYNEIERYCCDWLSNLMDAGLIAPGKIDDRSIVDVGPDDLAGFEQCHFFAGFGGWSRALRIEGVPDHHPVWTGSCPCQPFSLAGKQRGFADARHLWPVWSGLIRERRPATVFGEQVASASDWLRLVRSDLEVMGYAVGAIPIEAASAGADHPRDRYWFVANASSQRGAAGISGSIARQEGNARIPDDSSCEVGLADAHQLGSSPERQQRGREQCGPGCYPAPCALGDRTGLPEREPHHQGDTFADGRQARAISCGASDHLEWIIGADGKARRVKPGIRLLAHGIPARVAKLRALGNSIDPRPAAAFIGAAMSALSLSSQQSNTEAK